MHIKYIIIFLVGLELGKVIHLNNEPSILRPSFGTLYKFQGLLHHSFDRYYMIIKLILPKERHIFIKEMGEVHHYTLCSSGYIPSDFQTINI